MIKEELFNDYFWKAMTKKNSCYVTTPIYYVTAKPHLGSLYSTLIADVIKRWYALQGYKTFLLTGTDEHGQKVAQAAAAAGMPPKQFVDSFIDAYKNAWHTFEIDYTYFIRTTDNDHIRSVQHWIKQLMDQGDIYKSEYEGWYCTPCETFINETEINEQRQSGKSPHCLSCKRSVEQIKEEAYFFRLSAYQEKLLSFYEENKGFIVPKERAHEVLNVIKSGLKDISISRKNITWGIPFPGDDHHVTYVWADALNNYITAIGYGKKGQEAQFNQWWPATVQVLGKDIIRFHAIYWPAFLMASGLALPKQLLVHGWIQIDKQKMSKSLGNVVDPMDLYRQYGAEPVRYYLMRHMAINQDSNFSTADLEQSITSDLANDLGNLLNRMTSLAFKNNIEHINDPEVWSDGALQMIEESWNLIGDVQEYMGEYSFHMALARIWKFIHQANAYFHAHEPWKLAQSDSKKCMEVLAVTSHSLRVIATLLWPIMPQKMEQLLDSIGISLKPQESHNFVDDLELTWKGRSFMLKKIATLFEKYEPQEIKEEIKKIEPKNEEGLITIDDLLKVHLAVGTVIACDEVAASDKLYKLQIDFGDQGKRQILAGIKKSYSSDQLLGKQIVCVINLKPRMMLGFESQGMVFAVQDEHGRSQLITPFALVPNGSRLK